MNQQFTPFGELNINSSFSPRLPESTPDGIKKPLEKSFDKVLVNVLIYGFY